METGEVEALLMQMLMIEVMSIVVRDDGPILNVKFAVKLDIRLLIVGIEES